MVLSKIAAVETGNWVVVADQAVDRVVAEQIEDATDTAKAHLAASAAAAVDLDRFVFASEQAPAVAPAEEFAPASAADHPAKT